MTHFLNRAARKTAGAAIAALAMPALLIPTSAFADSYGHGYHSYNPKAACKADAKQDKITGAVIGSVIGGVLGSQVAGSGVRTEGTAIGAGIGALAGAGIADRQNDCRANYGRSYNQTYGSGNYQQQRVYNPQPVYTPPRTVYQSPRVQTYSPAPVYTQTRVYQQPVYHAPKRHKKHKRHYRQADYHAPVYHGSTRYSAPTYRQPRLTGTHYHGDYVCHGSH